MVSDEQAAAASDWSEWGVNLSPSARYVAAVAMCAVALLLRLALIPAEFGFPFLTFYPAVIFSALLLGPGPGFLALTLCAAAGRYFFMPPHWSFTFVWEDFFAVMIFFASGGVICLLMSNIRQRTADLRQREARLRGLYELSPVGIALTDMQGRYLEFNAAFQRMCGYPSDELKALDYWALTPNAYVKDEQRQLELLNTQGVYGPYEKEYIRRDGTRIPIRLHGSLIRGEGHQQYIWSIIEDITERRRAEADLERYRDHLEQLVVERTEQLIVAKEAAESANLAKSAFLANMSHEIRTPLNAISGMAYLIRRSGVTPQQAERLDKLEIASKHLLQLINAILDLSKIEAGHFAIDESVVDFDSVISDVRAMLQDKVQDKGLQLIIEATQLPAQVLCDPTRLKQALLNYASNAIKFTEHGSITLRVMPQEETADSVLLRFELQDTGIGIAPQDLGRLFNAFEQVDNSMTRKYGGSGLGLSITKRLAQLMGGDAGAISTPGVGSTFWFTARLKKVAAGGVGAAPASSYAEAAAAHHEFAAMRVLLAEDEPVNREITLAMLGELKLRVDCAGDGREALALVEKNTYDLILMDMQMPHMDGLTATSHIRQLAHGAKVPILALTANAFETDRERCMSVGMNDFIVKPFTADVLFAKLLKWLPHSVT